VSERFVRLRLTGQLRLPIVLAGIAVLLGLALWAGVPAIVRAFVALGLPGLICVVLIHLPIIVLLGIAWWSIGRSAGILSFVEARLVRDSVADVLPFSQVGGFAAGIRLLSLTGGPAWAGAFSLFADLLMEFFGKLFYAMAGLALLIQLRPGSVLPPYLMVALGLAIGASLLLLLLPSLLLRVVSRFLGRWTTGDSASSQLLSMLAPRRLAASGFLHAVCWILGGVEAWVTLCLMGVSVTLLEALAIDSLVMSLRTFGFWVPAALGVQEAAYVLVSGLFGLGPQVAIAFSLVRRARDLLIGVIGLAVWQGMEVTHTLSAAAGQGPDPQEERPDSLSNHYGRFPSPH
jgi:glycosyltransferase 2 family protein